MIIRRYTLSELLEKYLWCDHMQLLNTPSSWTMHHFGYRFIEKHDEAPLHTKYAHGLTYEKQQDHNNSNR
jgi:hypothetical protein